MDAEVVARIAAELVSFLRFISMANGFIEPTVLMYIQDMDS